MGGFDMVRCIHHKQLFRSFLYAVILFIILQLLHVRSIHKSNFNFKFVSTTSSNLNENDHEHLNLNLNLNNEKVNFIGSRRINVQSKTKDNRNETNIDLNKDQNDKIIKEKYEITYNKTNQNQSLNNSAIEFSMCAIIKDENNHLLEW